MPSRKKVPKTWRFLEKITEVRLQQVSKIPPSGADISHHHQPSRGPKNILLICIELGTQNHSPITHVMQRIRHPTAAAFHGRGEGWLLVVRA